MQMHGAPTQYSHRVNRDLEPLVSAFVQALLAQFDSEDWEAVYQKIGPWSRPCESGDEIAPLITVAEAANRAGVHRETVRRGCRTDAIKAIKLGRNWRIAPADLDTWLGLSADHGRPQPRHVQHRTSRSRGRRPLADAFSDARVEKPTPARKC